MRLVNQSHNQSCGLIIFSFVRTACQSVRHYPFYLSVRTAKQTVRTANQTVQIIYSPVRTVCPSVRNFYSSVRTADQTVQIIYSPVQTVRQTVPTLQRPFVNRSLSVRFCHWNGFPLVSVLPFTVTFYLSIVLTVVYVIWSENGYFSPKRCTKELPLPRFTNCFHLPWGEMIDKLTLTYNWSNLGSCCIGLDWELFIKSMS